MELLLCFIITVAILSFVLLIREISYKIVFYKYKFDSIIIIPLYSEEFSEIYLKYRIELIKNSNIDICKVILLDKGLSTEQCKICENIIKHNDILKFISISELSECISVLLK